MFQNWLDLTMKTASSNSLWAYIREGLLVEGYLRLRFGGAYFREGLFFWGGGGLLSEFYGILFLFLFLQIKAKNLYSSRKSTRKSTSPKLLVVNSSQQRSIRNVLTQE